MHDWSVSPEQVRDALAPFGPLRAQPPSDWQGEGPLHPQLVAFYGQVGPYGEDDGNGPEGLFVPALGNDFWLPPLGALWDLQIGYRSHGHSGARIADWPDEWIVVADQGGDPFILDMRDGTILHDRHGQGKWAPTRICDDIFALAMLLATIGAVHEAAGEDLYDDDFVVQPQWSAALRTRLTPLLGERADAIARRFDW